MATIQEFDQWHFQCLNPCLSSAKIVRYTARFNDFLEEIWSVDGEEKESDLVVSKVENCPADSTRPPAVRVRE